MRAIALLLLLGMSLPLTTGCAVFMKVSEHSGNHSHTMYSVLGLPLYISQVEGRQAFAADDMQMRELHGRLAEVDERTGQVARMIEENRQRIEELEIHLLDLKAARQQMELQRQMRELGRELDPPGVVRKKKPADHQKTIRPPAVE